MTFYDAGAAVAFVRKQVGLAYKWGADGPLRYDCSGLTMIACRIGGLELPHNAAEQALALNAQPVARGFYARRKLRPGDLVFYYTPISHCAMVVWVSRFGWRAQVVAATNESRGVELLRLFQYAAPTAYAYVDHQ